MTMLYRIEELRALESRARASLPPGELMRRAGEAAAIRIDVLLTALGSGPASVIVLCGPGDNGGDGFTCAAALQRRGHRCVCWAPLPSLSQDALAARAHWLSIGGQVTDELPINDYWHLAVDALLGIGARRPLAEPLLGALRWVQTRAFPLIALDVPSGLDADRGTWVGSVAGAPAKQTVTFLADKPGLHLPPGRDAAGSVHVESLGIEAWMQEHAAQGALNGPERFAEALVPRRRDSNKGDFGMVVAIGGAAGMVGAILLAARSALRLGAGKVVVECVGAPDLRFDPAQPELMIRSDPPLPAQATVVAGCGLGVDAQAHARLHRLLLHPGPVVLDADALNCIAGDPDLGQEVQARRGATVLTPHPGEAARLLQSDAGSVQMDRIESAQRLARLYQAVIALKGAATVIADPSGTYVVNPTGGPALASAGTGDVLAGMIGALLAQGIDCVQAARAAVWLHGQAADSTGLDVGLVASDIGALAARALSALRAGAANPAGLEQHGAAAAGGQTRIVGHQ